jgi:hypothetical protein
MLHGQEAQVPVRAVEGAAEQTSIEVAISNGGCGRWGILFVVVLPSDDPSKLFLDVWL